MGKALCSTLVVFGWMLLASCSGGGGGGDTGTDTPPPGDTGTETGGPDAPTCPSDFPSVQAIFTQSCAVSTATCHGPTGTQAPHLNTGPAYHNIVSMVSQEYGLGVTPAMTMDLVTPANTATSFLYHKLLGDMASLPGCSAPLQNCGVMMPMVGGSPLTPTQMCTIRTWIENGAQDF